MNKIIREILETSKMILVSVVIAFFIRSTVMASAVVPTGSMESTIMTGSRIMINRLAYIADTPSRGDIVSFIMPDDGKTQFLKRVMGLPGETIQGINGRIYIDGVVLEEDYTDIIITNDFGPFVVPEDCYFMMGDNRNNSWDSRYWNNHFVEKDAIIGQAFLEFYPELKVLTN